MDNPKYMAINDVQKDNQAKILIIIPAYNEEASIAAVIQKIQKHVPCADILVINDGSMDNTVKEASSAGAHVIDLPFNLGIGGAMQTGYLYASRHQYDIAVQTDADGQHDPKYLSHVITPVIKGSCDMAIGSRYVSQTAYKSSLSRRMGMIFFSTIIKLLTGQRIKDTTSGFRAVNKKVIDFFAKNYPTDYPEVEVLVSLYKKRFTINEVSVEMKDRQGGSSSITPFRSMYYMTKVSLALVINTIRS